VAFSDSLQNAVTFVLLCSTKVLASLASILAKQGFRGIRSNLRRAAGPLKLPRIVSPFSIMGRFFDKVKSRCLFGSGISLAILAIFPRLCYGVYSRKSLKKRKRRGL
jgi:hypothetical protein